MPHARLRNVTNRFRREPATPPQLAPAVEPVEEPTRQLNITDPNRINIRAANPTVPDQPVRLQPGTNVGENRGFLGIRGRVRDFREGLRTEEGRSAVFGFAGAIASAAGGERNEAIARFAEGQRAEIARKASTEADLSLRERQFATRSEEREEQLQQGQQIIDLRTAGQEQAVTQQEITNELNRANFLLSEDRVDIAERSQITSEKLQTLREEQAGQSKFIPIAGRGLFQVFPDRPPELVEGSEPVQGAIPRLNQVTFPDGGKGFAKFNQATEEFEAVRFGGEAGQAGPVDAPTPAEQNQAQRTAQSRVLFLATEAVVKLGDTNPEVAKEISENVIFQAIRNANAAGTPLDESTKSSAIATSIAILKSHEDTADLGEKLRIRTILLGSAIRDRDFVEADRLSKLTLEDPNEQPAGSAETTTTNLEDGTVLNFGPGRRLQQ